MVDHLFFMESWQFWSLKIWSKNFTPLKLWPLLISGFYLDIFYHLWPSHTKTPLNFHKTWNKKSIYWIFMQESVGRHHFSGRRPSLPQKHYRTLGLFGHREKLLNILQFGTKDQGREGWAINLRCKWEVWNIYEKNTNYAEQKINKSIYQSLYPELVSFPSQGQGYCESALQWARYCSCSVWLSNSVNTFFSKYGECA